MTIWVGVDFGGSFTPLFWFPDNRAKIKAFCFVFIVKKNTLLIGMSGLKKVKIEKK